MLFSSRVHACPSQSHERSTDSHLKRCCYSVLLLLLFPASIVTVIRLVNDAVDDIESEGRSAFLFTHLSLLHLPLGAFKGVGLGLGVLNAAVAFFFNPDSINKK